MLAVSIASLLIYAFVWTFYGDPLEEISLKQSSAQIFLLEHYIDQAAKDEWLVRLNKAREVSSLKVEIIELPVALSD